MSSISILNYTPIWVWAIMVFLLLRGIDALSDREMPLSRLFLLPIFFFLWSGYDVFHKIHKIYISFPAYLLGLSLGGVIGWLLWKKQPRLRQGKKSGTIIHSGTALFIVNILSAFVSKLALLTILGFNPFLASSSFYAFIFGFLSGIFSGMFWGGTLNLSLSWYKGG